MQVHWTKGLFAARGGSELPLVLFTCAYAFGIGGPGPYAVDAWLGLAPQPGVFAGLTMLAVVVALVASWPRQSAASAARRHSQAASSTAGAACAAPSVPPTDPTPRH